MKAGRELRPALTAAASKIRYSRQTASSIKEAPWVNRAWDVYDKLGPIYYMTRYRSSVARKIDYFAAIKEVTGDPDPDVTLDQEGEISQVGEATKVLEAEGGSDLLRRIVSELMVHWDVAGEAYLVRFDSEPFWRVLSTMELKKSAAGYFTWGDERTMGEIDPDGVYRVWKPHPRNHWEADSPTRHVLDDAEGLILSGREIRARSISRLAAGVWPIPDTVDFTPFGDDQDGTEDDFAREMTNYLAKPLTDPGSAASLAPWIITVGRDDIEAISKGPIRFDREWDVSIELREEQLHHVALGIDMPPELATGTAGSMNHWGSWWLTDEAVNMHVLPTVDDILDSLTQNWYRPLLQAASVDPDKYVLWRDSSPATVAPDRSDVAIKMFEVGAISGKALRRVTDFDEEDKPDEEDNPQPIEEEPTIEGPPEQEGVTGSVDLANLQDLLTRIEQVLKEGGGPLAPRAVTAAARPPIRATELSEIDAEVLAFVIAEAEQEIERLLGMAITAADDPLDESLLSRFRQRIEEKMAEAQVRARQWVQALISRTLSDQGELLARQAGAQTIVSGLLNAIRQRLFTPQAGPDPIDIGQRPEFAAPIDVIREGLSEAGGGPARYEPGHTSELIANGTTMSDELQAAGYVEDSYVWIYGHPAHAFEPHRRLADTTFDDWDSPKLAVGLDGAWIGASFYRPGDHRGCQCRVEKVLLEPDLVAGPPADGIRRATTPPHSDVLARLTDDEQQALFEYTSENGYKSLNAALREGRALTPDQQRIADALNKAMGERNGSTTTWRGMWTESPEEYDRLLSTFRNADEIRLPGFQSTSFDPSYPVSMFAEGETGLMFEVRSRGGALLNDPRLTTAPGEVELVLPHNLKYRVVEIQDNAAFESTFFEDGPQIERRTLVILEEI